MTATSGTVSNHGDYERVACIIFCAVTPLFVIARSWSRISAKQFGADDWAATAAFCFVLASTVQTLVAFNYGWGHHTKELSSENLKICLILHWTFQLTYKISVALNKTSILLLYKRILVQSAHQALIWALLSIVVLFAVATSIAGIFQCVPVHKAWNKHIPGHCYNLVAAWYSNAVFSIVTDLLILMLPMHMIWVLQVKKKEKLLLVGMFGLGGFVTFTSIMRFFALKAAASTDATYDINSGFWSVIEINVGVICVSLPPLRVFIARHLPSLRRSHISTGEASGRARYSRNGSGHVQLYDSSKVSAESRDNGLLSHVRVQPGRISKQTEVIVVGRDKESQRPSDEIELDPFRNQL